MDRENKVERKRAVVVRHGRCPPMEAVAGDLVVVQRRHRFQMNGGVRTGAPVDTVATIEESGHKIGSALIFKASV